MEDDAKTDVMDVKRGVRLYVSLLLQERGDVAQKALERGLGV